MTVNGALRTYGCDPVTRENITAINTAISRAPHLVPNPRPYTPKGEAPVMTMHEEFLAIYLAGLAKGDTFYQAYYAHKTAILALETVERVIYISHHARCASSSDRALTPCTQGELFGAAHPEMQELAIATRIIPCVVAPAIDLTSACSALIACY